MEMFELYIKMVKSQVGDTVMHSSNNITEAHPSQVDKYGFPHEEGTMVSHCIGVFPTCEFLYK